MDGKSTMTSKNLHMGETYVQELAEKFMRFNFKLGKWNLAYFNKNKTASCRVESVPLTHRQFSILFIIDAQEPSTVSKLQDITNLSKSSLSLTISKLVEGGFIIKNTPVKNDDGRKVYLNLTAKGKKALEICNLSIKAVFAAFYESLDDRQKKNLSKAIKILDDIF